MSQKIRKTLYLPQWVVKLLEKEGDISEGPGLIAAAAIYDFCTKKHEDKRDILKEYLNYAIDSTYGCGGSIDIAEPIKKAVRKAGSQSLQANSRRKKADKPSESG